MPLDAFREPLRCYRLRDERVTAEGRPRCRLFLGHDRGQENDRHVLQFRVGVDLRGHVPTVELRHHHVEQDQVRLENLRGFERAR